tara:strand:- start:1131 stop:1589 length:459 start_codon:yes stop_codon:yes gene_type:complete
MSNNHNTYSEYKKKPIYAKRLENELKPYHPTFINNTTCEFIYNSKKITLYVDTNFPFKPPIDVYIDGHSTSNIPSRLLDHYILATKECPCCVSMASCNNWKPACKIEDLLNERISIRNKILELRTISQHSKYILDRSHIPDFVENKILAFII